MAKTINQIRAQRKRRARAKIFGTAEKPRLSVFRSNRYTYAQLIDDMDGKTLVGASTQELAKNKKPASAPADAKALAGRQKVSKKELAEKLGGLISEKAMEKGIKKAVFSRGKYRYHGRIKAIAEGARKGGLQI